MEIELLLHGVPNGHDFYGPREDQPYAGTFYTISSQYRERFHVEVRKSGSKMFCYYHLLLSDNIVSSDGRRGGYFGLAIRTDCYILRPLTIYSLLKVVCETRVLGSILTRVEGSLKYTTDRFSHLQNVIQVIEQDLGRYLTPVMSSQNVTAISLQMMGSQHGIVTRSLQDTSDEDILNCLIACGKVVVSPFAQSVTEMQLRKDLQKKEKEVSIVNAEVLKLQKEAEDSRAQHAEEIASLYEKLAAQSRGGQVSDLRQQAHIPDQPHEQHQSSKGKGALLGVLMFVLAFGVIGAFFYFFI